MTSPWRRKVYACNPDKNRLAILLILTSWLAIKTTNFSSQPFTLLSVDANGVRSSQVTIEVTNGWKLWHGLPLVYCSFWCYRWSWCHRVCLETPVLSRAKSRRTLPSPRRSSWLISITTTQRVERSQSRTSSDVSQEQVRIYSSYLVHLLKAIIVQKWCLVKILYTKNWTFLPKKQHGARQADKKVFRPLEVEFLVRVSQKTKFGAGFPSTFVFRH